MSPSFRQYCLRALCLSTFLSSTSWLEAQIPQGAGINFSVDQLEIMVLPAQDNEALLAEEMQQRRAGRAPRFATAIPVRVNPATAGRWDRFGDLAIWRFRLYSPGAHSLNLGFQHYQMPEGGQLFLYDPQRREMQGPFTPADNESHNQLWTPVFPGDELVVEIRVPSAKKSKLNIELSVVNHDFVGFGNLNSGSCNLDIVCGTEDGWDIVEPFRDVSRSVGLYSVRGVLLCTGFLVNNTRQDCTPYFLTADHCEISTNNAPSVIVYWNFENSSCRQPGSTESGDTGDGKLDDFNTGAIFRAAWSNSDFCLIELDDPVSETANAYFSGWSALDEPAEGTVVSVHHPFTDEKRISFSEDTTYYGFWGSNQGAVNGNHIIVNSWTTGTTQSGSSGGPLFNTRGQAIGQLHGGDAACGNQSYDSFGRLYNSWEGGGTPDSRLKDWLDPIGTGKLFLEGKEENRCNFTIIGSFASGTVCAGDSDTLNLFFGGGFLTRPEVSVGAIPFELNINVEDISEDTGIDAQLIWKTNAGTPGGTQTFEIYTSYEGQVDTTFVSLNIITDEPAQPVLNLPPDGSTATSLEVAVSWLPAVLNEAYQVQIALDPGFEAVILDQTVRRDSQLTSFDLQPEISYYWRVAGINACGTSEWSSTFNFITANLQCGQRGTDADPITISSASASTVRSDLEIDLSGNITSIEVINVDIQHNWIGDLSIVLQSPAGREVVLLDRPGFPSSLFGCNGTDLLLNFNEEAVADYESLETTCGSSSPSISGTYRPLESLESLVGEMAAGVWTLIVKDNAEEDGGRFIGWELSICTIPETTPLLTGLFDAYETCIGDSLGIELVVSDAFEGPEVVLDLDAAVAAATFSKNPAAPGDTVLLSLNKFTLPGNYALQLSVSDGTTSEVFPFDLTVQPLPPIANLEAPADNAGISDPNTTFSWNSSGASLYRLEIAADAEFQNQLQSVETTDNFYTPELSEQQGLFFWRVITVNDCGESISEVFSFQFTTSATSVFPDGQKLRVFPNPFGDVIHLEFNRSLEREVSVRLLDINGRTLYEDFLIRGLTRRQLFPGPLSAGVYMLEFRYNGQRYVERLIKGR